VAELISVEEAQRLVLSQAKPLQPERVPIERAYGRVLAQPAQAQTDLPPFPSSAMDGFAVRSADLAAAPVSLRLVGSAPAGSPSPARLGAGEAIAISTGGAVPDGADAVVPVELTRVSGDRVEVVQAVASGANVRRRGGDVTAGSRVLAAGSYLGGAQVGALAAAGVGEVQCAKRPRVGILVTGSELRRPGEQLAPGEIYESNGLMLAGLLTGAGAVPAQLGTVPDDADRHRSAMEKALLAFDMLITTGGASVGAHDLVRRVLSELRTEEVFWGVAIKPGRPVAFGVRRDHLVFSLPGNPVSALVCFELLVRPAVNALLGMPEPLPRLLTGRLATPLRRDPQRDEFVRVCTRSGEDEVLLLEPVGGQESHMIVSAAYADALCHVPRGDGELPAGSAVRYLRLA
jgi:molybdopterin molybdotransferase